MAGKQHKRFAGLYSEPVNSFQILPWEQNCSGDTKIDPAAERMEVRRETEA